MMKRTSHTACWIQGLLLTMGACCLLGCANPMLRQASADCDPEAYRLFPLVMQTQRMTEPVVVQVPDGTHHCVSEAVRQGDRSTTLTRCKPNYMVQTRWVDRWIQVDLNAKERGIWHERCVQQLCVQRVGHPACEQSSNPINPATPGAPASTPIDAPALR